MADTPQSQLPPRRLKILDSEASGVMEVWQEYQQELKRGGRQRRVEPFEDWYNQRNLSEMGNKEDFPYDESKFRYLTQSQYNTEDRAKREKYSKMYKEKGVRNTYEEVKRDWLMDHPGETFQVKDFQRAIRGSVEPTDMSGKIMSWLKAM